MEWREIGPENVFSILCRHVNPQLYALSCLLLSHNRACRPFPQTFFPLDFKPNKVHWKLQKYIYILTCTHCGIEYVGESITPLNLRIDIHSRRQSEFEIFIDHYWVVCKNAAFSIQIIEKLLGNACENGIKDNAMLDYRLQREDYWMKTLCTVYPCNLNEITKYMNKDRETFPTISKIW